MLVRPAVPVDRLHFVTTAVGLAAVDACAEVTGIELGLKWPNDLVTLGADVSADLKVAGILAETTSIDGHIDAVIVGIGINVNWPDDLPPELAGIATSLRHLTSAEVDRETLAVQLIARTDHWLARLEAGELDEIVTEYRGRSATLGREVRVEVPGSVIHGRAVDIDLDGALHVADSHGADHVVGVGDVVHLRLQP